MSYQMWFLFLAIVGLLLVFLLVRGKCDLWVPLVEFEAPEKKKPETTMEFRGILEWKKSLDELVNPIQSIYPRGTIIEFMGIEYCVVGYISRTEKMLGYPMVGLVCSYVDGHGNPKEHFFPPGLFCVIHKCIKSIPEDKQDGDES